MASIIVHGGAGTVEDSRVARCISGCEAAALAGFDVLQKGGAALDAVEAAVRALEDDPEFNAGYGSVLNQMGIVEVDAAIMDGQLRGGAVGAVPWLRHPVTLARKILDGGQHVLLVGGGALFYAREHGIAPDPPHTMVAPRALARWEKEVGAPLPPGVPRSGGTVGAVAVDGQGRVAAATSTGGTSGKRPGRVGDTPLLGAGTYADDEAGAASATGHGESILKICMTKIAVERMRGEDAMTAARAAVEEAQRRTGVGVGIITVGRDGRVGHFSGTPRMPWASIVDGSAAAGVENE